MSRSLKVVITPRAAEDITEIRAWLGARNPSAADEWLSGISALILGLGAMPEACPVAPETREFDIEIRRALYGKATRWRIYYSFLDDSIHILHVRHGRRSEWIP